MEKLKLFENPLDVIVGVDEHDEIIKLDLARARHILVGGVTGSGKTIGILGVLTSLMAHHKDTSTLKIFIHDPSRVEYGNLADNPFITLYDEESPFVELNEIMDERYELLSGQKAKNIEEYNKRVSESEKLPYIVTVVEHLAYTMNVEDDCEKKLTRLLQKSRGAGIHLIITTQTPRREVITGTIKANIPTRLSFMVSSQKESMCILDEVGAELLPPRGAFILKSAYDREVRYGQAPFVSQEAITEINAYANQNI